MNKEPFDLVRNRYVENASIPVSVPIITALIAAGQLVVIVWGLPG